MRGDVDVREEKRKIGLPFDTAHEMVLGFPHPLSSRRCARETFGLPGRAVEPRSFFIRYGTKLTYSRP